MTSGRGGTRLLPEARRAEPDSLVHMRGSTGSDSSFSLALPALPCIAGFRIDAFLHPQHLHVGEHDDHMVAHAWPGSGKIGWNVEHLTCTAGLNPEIPPGAVPTDRLLTDMPQNGQGDTDQPSCFSRPSHIVAVHQLSIDEVQAEQASQPAMGVLQQGVGTCRREAQGAPWRTGRLTRGFCPGWPGGIWGSWPTAAQPPAARQARLSQLAWPTPGSISLEGLFFLMSHATSPQPTAHSLSQSARAESQDHAGCSNTWPSCAHVRHSDAVLWAL